MTLQDPTLLMILGSVILIPWSNFAVLFVLPQKNYTIVYEKNDNFLVQKTLSFVISFFYF